MSSCKYEILTDRDKKILELVEQLKVVDVFTVDNILFKNTKCNRVCQRRLTNLSEFNRIKRWRPNQISPYIYYLGRKPGNIDHSLLISHFVAYINILGGEVVKLKREWLIHEGIRIDLFIGYKLNGKNYIAIVEAENTKNFDKKYEKLEEYYLSNSYKELFPTMPKVICITDKPFKPGILDVVKIDTDFKNINILLED